MESESHAFATRAVHAGHDVDPTTGAHATPIHATSTFVYGDAARGRRLFAGEESLQKFYQTPERYTAEVMQARLNRR